MIVYHLVQSVQQCLCNDCVSFKAKHMYRVDLENEYEMAFFRNGAKVPILFNISILYFSIIEIEHAENQDVREKSASGRAKRS